MAGQKKNPRPSVDAVQRKMLRLLRPHAAEPRSSFGPLSSGFESAAAGAEQDDDDWPEGLPRCIPREAAEIFFRASPEQQKKLIQDASVPHQVIRHQPPVLKSMQMAEKKGFVCLCSDFAKCPYEPRSNPVRDHPDFDGIALQIFPVDNQWWTMRELVTKLAATKSTTS